MVERYFRLTASLSNACLYYFLCQRWKQQHINLRVHPASSVSQRLIYILVWKLGLTALVTSTSNLKTKGLHFKCSEYNTPPPFLGHQPVLVITEEIQDTFSLRKVIPLLVVGTTTTIEMKWGGWAPLYRQHLAYSPWSTFAGFLLVYFFKLS